jgi:hypothetical protein
MDQIFLDRRAAGSAVPPEPRHVPSVHRLDPGATRPPPRAGTPSCWPARRPPSFTARAGSASWARCFGHDTYFLYAEQTARSGRAAAGHVNSWLFGNSLVGLPFAVYGGVAASRRGRRAGAGAEAAAHRPQLGVDHLELRNVDRAPRRLAAQDLYVTFRKPILPEEEANMLAIPRKQRAMVRKGIKNELVSSIDTDVDRFFALYADNVHRHGTPAMPKRYFRR